MAYVRCVPNGVPAKGGGEGQTCDKRHLHNYRPPVHAGRQYVGFAVSVWSFCSCVWRRSVTKRKRRRPLGGWRGIPAQEIGKGSTHGVRASETGHHPGPTHSSSNALGDTLRQNEMWGGRQGTCAGWKNASTKKGQERDEGRKLRHRDGHTKEREKGASKGPPFGSSCCAVVSKKQQDSGTDTTRE